MNAQKGASWQIFGPTGKKYWEMKNKEM